MKNSFMTFHEKFHHFRERFSPGSVIVCLFVCTGLLEKPYDARKEDNSIRKLKNMYRACINEGGYKNNLKIK
jgi:hypothetical protein